MRDLAVVIGIMAVLSAAWLSGSAAAAPLVFQGSFGSFSTPEGLAVDQEMGAVYVFDPGTKTISRFDEGGSPLAFTASETYVTGNQLTGTSDGDFNFLSGQTESEIAIAPPGSTAGTDGDLYTTNGATAVAVFDSSGHYLGSITAPGGGSFSLVCGVSVDPDGSVYIADYSNGAVYKFVPSGQPATNLDFDSAITGLSQPCNISTSGSTLYAATWSNGPIVAYPLSLFPGSGASVDVSGSGTTVQDEGVGATSTAAYVDPATSELYVDEGNRGAVFDSSAALLEHFGAGEGLSNSRGIAIRGSSNIVYLSDTGAGAVRIYSPPVPGAPNVTISRSSRVTSTEANLEGVINPSSVTTEYHFEYVDDNRFQETGFSQATSIPVPSADIGNGFQDVPVKDTISGLLPGTIYHYRLVASNSLGTTAGASHQLVTYQVDSQPACSNVAWRTGLSAVLADCRAYEQVTPAQKDFGPNIILGSAISSIDGESTVYNTGGPLPNATAGPYFSDNRASRTSSGWVSHSISPPQAPSTQLGALGVFPYYHALKPDLSKAVVVSANPPLTPDALEFTPNLYLQELNPTGFSLLSPAGNAIVSQLAYGGSSADWSYQYFAATTPQTPDAPPESTINNGQVYGIKDGQIYLVGILPDGSIPNSAKFPRATSTDSRQTKVMHMVSEDGTRVFFQAGSSFNEAGTTLFLRINAGQPEVASDPSGHCVAVTLACTVMVSASEKTNGAGPGGADPNGPMPIEYQEASADGSRVAFTSASELTNDAYTGRNGFGESTDLGSDLYVYDQTAGELTDISVDGNPADGSTGAKVLGVLAASEDLSKIYFAASGDLTGSAVSGEANLYLWDDGSLAYIATLDPTLDEANWAGPDGLAVAWSSRATPDGRFLAFNSVKPLTGFDNVDAETGIPDRQVFLFDSQDAQLVCASCNPSGSAPIGESAISGISATSGLGGGFNMPRNLSVDGKRVFFNSLDALVPRDSNRKRDVYVYEDGKVSLLSSGTGSGGKFMDASPTGNDAFFITDQQLVPQDRDGLVDLYDARVGGGFAPTDGVSSCSAEACRPPVALPPESANPSSATFIGPRGRANRRRKHACKRHHRNGRPIKRHCRHTKKGRGAQ